MGLDRFLHVLASDPEFKEAVVDTRVEEPRRAVTRPFADDLEPSLRAALERRGIQQLYTHQAEAHDLARAGRSFVVTTPTASGKSLCFHLPVLDALLKDATARALYLYPTKALSRDQVADLGDLVPQLSRKISVHVYDGDTPGEVRRMIRDEADIVVTNPYMLHTGILPNHTQWIRLFSGLRYVVLDELHVYTGVFGSHVSNVLRRLRRVAAHYGSSPVFILCSATLANPRELGEALVGTKLESLTRSGAALGERRFFFINPPIVNAELGLRRSAVEEARRLALPILESGIQALFFERTRNGVEVLVKYLKDLALKEGYDPARIAGYRGGYLPDLRREIERGLRTNTINIVVATNALELGIDIGSLDAVVLVGYPGSVASTFQRAGRAGRKQGPSAVVMVAKALATDQYVTAHPGYLFGSPPEHATVDPDNLIIRVNQLKCAAFELPFREGEEFGGAGDTAEILDFLEREAGILRKSGGRYHWMARHFPAENVPLDAGDIDNFIVHDMERRVALGEVDRPSVMTTIHEGAIYNHQGEQYAIERLDYEARRAEARKVQVDYFTEAIVEAAIEVRHVDREEQLGPYARFLAQVGVTKVAPNYKKIRFYTRENIGSGEIHLPPEKLETEALILAIDEDLARETGVVDPSTPTSFKGASRLLRRVVPLFVRCDPGDIGVEAQRRSAFFDRPAIVVWDDVPGGVGLAEKAFELIAPILQAMAEILGRCPCRGGCPACIGAVLGEEVQDKRAVLRLVEALARRAPPPVESREDER
ncbi:MAG: DEAD/DEAH box helicase [Planctomycetota bacterium]